MCDWKAEMNLRTPRRPCGITIYAAHNKRGQRNERKCFATGPASATGEGGRGTSRTSPGAIRRPPARCSLPSGQLACSCAQKLLLSGRHACSCCNAKLNIKLTHSKVAVRHYGHCAHGLPRTSTDWHGRHGSSKAADRPGIVPVPDAMQSSDIKLACDLKADGRNPEYLAVFHSKPWNFKDLRILYNESENQDITGGLTDGGDGSGAGSDA